MLKNDFVLQIIYYHVIMSSMRKCCCAVTAKQVISEAGVSGWRCCRREALERASQEAEAEQPQLGDGLEQCPQKGKILKKHRR